MSATESSTLGSLPEFVISRTFDASPTTLWAALTEPARMEKWLSPKGSSSRVVAQDFRPGGIYHYCMSTPDGHEMWGKMVYREIRAPHRLEYINAFSDSEGGTTRHPMSATWPLEMLSVFSLTEETPGRTTLTLTWTPFHASDEEVQTFEAAHAGMTQGWTGTLDNLTEYLKS